MAMMLSLSLCFAGCAAFRSPREIQPAVTQGPQGNAVLATLPPGTVVYLPTLADGQKIHAAFLNEVNGTNRTDGTYVLEVVRPLKVCTPAYIAERDATEMELHRRLLQRESGAGSQGSGGGK